RLAAVRQAVLRDAQEVPLARQRPRSRDGPRLELIEPRVCRAPVEGSGVAVVVPIGNGRRADETGELRCNRRGRVAGLFFPPFLRRRWSVRDDEVGGGTDVFAVRAGIGASELVGEDDRIGDFV